MVRPPFGRKLIGESRAAVGHCDAFIAPEVEHVHLGFEYGAWMVDPDNLLRGAHLNLRKVRYVTYQPDDPIPEPALIAYTRDATALATMSGAERLARDLPRITIP
jgi:hypothetical protein